MAETPAYVIVCPEQPLLAPDGAALCSAGWLAQPAVAPFDPAQIDPVVAGQLLGVGFATVLVVWVPARIIRALVDLINQHTPRPGA
ncbi:hypothetical protein D3C80_1496100 [compost metagenome]